MKRMFVQSGLALVGITGQLLLPLQVKAASPCSTTSGGTVWDWECPKPGQCKLEIEYDEDGRVSLITGTCV